MGGKVGLLLFNVTLRQNKVVAVPKLESAQPSLKIKEELTFNAQKAHREGRGAGAPATQQASFI